MEMYIIQSQLAHNASVIRDYEFLASENLLAMKHWLEEENYQEAREYQKQYRYYKNNLRFLVACQKALKKDKKQAVAMWRFHKVMERFHASFKEE